MLILPLREATLSNTDPFVCICNQHACDCTDDFALEDDEDFEDEFEEDEFEKEASLFVSFLSINFCASMWLKKV